MSTKAKDFQIEKYLKKKIREKMIQKEMEPKKAAKAAIAMRAIYLVLILSIINITAENLGDEKKKQLEVIENAAFYMLGKQEVEEFTEDQEDQETLRYIEEMCRSDPSKIGTEGLFYLGGYHALNPEDRDKQNASELRNRRITAGPHRKGGTNHQRRRVATVPRRAVSSRRSRIKARRRKKREVKSITTLSLIVILKDQEMVMIAIRRDPTTTGNHPLRRTDVSHGGDRHRRRAQGITIIRPAITIRETGIMIVSKNSEATTASQVLVVTIRSAPRAAMDLARPGKNAIRKQAFQPRSVKQRRLAPTPATLRRRRRAHHPHRRNPPGAAQRGSVTSFNKRGSWRN